MKQLPVDFLNMFGRAEARQAHGVAPVCSLNIEEKIK